MNATTRRWLGWGLSLLLFVFLAGVSAGGKFTDWEGKAEMMARMGFSIELMKKIGVLEVVVAALFLIPRSAFVGAILLTGYLGGAIVTHLRVGDPVWMPIIFGVLVWIALGLRVPSIFALAAGQAPSAT